MLMADRMDGVKSSEIRELLKVLERPGIISFAGGIPDPSLFPKEKFQSAMSKLLKGNDGAQSLQYSISEGYAPLREWLVEEMKQQQVDCSVDNILITTGSQQALDLIARLYISRGDKVYVKKPTYLGALQAFGAYQPEFDLLDLEGDSLIQDLTSQRAKLAYACTDFANPDGHTLTLLERHSAIKFAQDRDIPLVEDAAYQALRYHGQTLPCVLSLELQKISDINSARTIYCGSFSKTLSPGMRVGWVCASKHIIEKLVLLKQAVDLHSPTLGQMAVYDVVQDGFAQHKEMLRTVYARKMTTMLESLARFMPEGVSWSHPDGGMFVWLQLPEYLDAKELLQNAINDHGVAYVPGQAFHFDGSGRSTLRLNFSHPSLPDIEAGVEKLSELIRQWV